MATWMKYTCTNNTTVVINLDEATAFEHAWGIMVIRIYFHEKKWAISKDADPETYQRILDYIEQHTGQRIVEVVEAESDIT